MNAQFSILDTSQHDVGDMDDNNELPVHLCGKLIFNPAAQRKKKKKKEFLKTPKMMILM